MPTVVATKGKSLTIDFGYSEPRFTFTGSWEGRDIKIVQALIRREYFRYQRSVRRDAESKTEELSAIG